MTSCEMGHAGETMTSCEMGHAGEMMTACEMGEVMTPHVEMV